MKFLARVFLNQIRWNLKHLHINFESQSFDYNQYFPSSFYLSLVMASNRYCIDLAKRGTAGCKNCNAKIEKGVVRIGKIIANPFTDSGGEMKQWFHVKCIFDKLSRARATTKKIEDTDDLEGWNELGDEHKPEVLKCLSEFSSSLPTKKTPQKKAPQKASNKNKKEEESAIVLDEESEPTEDDTFRKFRKICTKLAKHPKYTEKTSILANFFTKGSDGEGFKGNLYLWVKMLLPAVEKRVYNLQTTQLLKIFSKIFDVEADSMIEDYDEGGDVSETIKIFFEKSNSFEPAEESTLYLQQIDKYLDQLTTTGSEVEQTRILTKVAKRCTSSDLKYLIRLIKHDLRMNAGPKHVLEAIHPTAYDAFQASRDLKGIIKRSKNLSKNGNAGEQLTVRANLMTPVLPMLATACKDLEKTPFTKCPDGLYVEIKYDGERVQLHKRGNEFNYFSRSLKPVAPHKIAHLKDYIPKAFPHGNDLMLDCEILLVDNDGTPLPFGSLGAHRKTAFKDASVCLFIFDCLQFNDENLMNKPLVERRKILEKNMTTIKNHIVASELKEINSKKELKDITYSVFDQGLEGIVIKAKDGIYEPGKRHWLKVKKDYLTKDGKGMADSADLVVLGAYFGTGRKAGKMSVFLMGCYNKYSKKWCTVTKVPGGDDATLAALTDEFKETMKKISKDPCQVPSWLNINKSLVPDFVAREPKDCPVWEISGAEFSKAEIHTASGISIRFPRVKRVRPDKTWETATNLKELEKLYEVSKDNEEIIGLKTATPKKHARDDDDDDDDSNTGVADKSASSSNSSFGETPRKKFGKTEKSPSKKVKREHDVIESSTKQPQKKKFDELDKPLVKKSKKESNDEPTPVKKPKLDSSSRKALFSPSTSSSSTSHVLQNIFTGVKLHIPPSIEDSEKLRRYFIASHARGPPGQVGFAGEIMANNEKYDGVLLKDHETNEASHVISTIDESALPTPEEAQKVTVDWLWDSIKLQKKLSTDLYKPES